MKGILLFLIILPILCFAQEYEDVFIFDAANSCSELQNLSEEKDSIKFSHTKHGHLHDFILPNELAGIQAETSVIENWINKSFTLSDFQYDRLQILTYDSFGCFNYHAVKIDLFRKGEFLNGNIYIKSSMLDGEVICPVNFHKKQLATIFAKLDDLEPNQKTIVKRRNINERAIGSITYIFKVDNKLTGFHRTYPSEPIIFSDLIHHLNLESCLGSFHKRLAVSQ